MSVKVEMVDTPFGYNILLGRKWINAMKATALSVFCVVCFPFKDQIVTIDHTSFDNYGSSASSGLTIPIIDHS